MTTTSSAPTRNLACRPAAVSTSAAHPDHADGRCASNPSTAAHRTLAYLAAYDVHRAHVIGHCAPTTGIEPFTALAAKVMTTEPYASARRVFWVVDNGASRSGWIAAARLNDTWSNATMIHLPVHASWLNQVEMGTPCRHEATQGRQRAPGPP